MTDQRIHTLQEKEGEAEEDLILVDLTAQIEEEIEAEAGEDLTLQKEGTQEVAQEEAVKTADKKEEPAKTPEIAAKSEREVKRAEEVEKLENIARTAEIVEEVKTVDQEAKEADTTVETEEVLLEDLQETYLLETLRRILLKTEVSPQTRK
jgi:PP-loop superfamily ATP-utilizing enzyme